MNESTTENRRSNTKARRPTTTTSLMSNVKDYRYLSPLSGAKAKVPDMTCPRAVRYLGETWPPPRCYEEELSKLSERIEKTVVEKKEAREQACRIQCDILLRKVGLAKLQLAVLNQSEAIRELEDESESILAGVDDLEDELQGELFEYRVAKMTSEGKVGQLEVSSHSPVSAFIGSSASRPNDRRCFPSPGPLERRRAPHLEARNSGAVGESDCSGARQRVELPADDEVGYARRVRGGTPARSTD
jgi:hypothetical protein